MVSRPAVLLALLVLVGGCATARDVYLADGSKGYNINCGGALMNFANCLEKAGELCGSRGYLVVNQQGDAIPISTAGGSFSASPTAAGGGFFAQSGTIVTRNLLVKCR